MKLTIPAAELRGILSIKKTENICIFNLDNMLKSLLFINIVLLYLVFL